jgi:arylsulfatase A-like enzyme
VRREGIVVGVNRRWPLLLTLLGVVAGAALLVFGPIRTGAPDPTIVLRPALAAKPSPPAGAPNVVLVIGCTLRQDQVGTYGGPPGLTPFLDRLAAGGTVFEDLIVAGPWTRVASAAIVTGQHAVALGMVEPGPLRNDRALPASAVTISESLRGAGWHTIGFTANPNLNAVFGFDQGFDAYKQLPSLWRDDGVKLSTDRALDGLLDLVDEAPTDRPVYLQAMLIDAHSPYVATAAEGERWSQPGEPAVVGEYRAGLRRLDRAIERLWTGLERRGWSRDNTLFLVLSDHGEGLSWPAHHGKGHGRFLSPSAVHGVWISWGAGIGVGHRVGGVASQVDVLPTVLSLVGVPGLEGPGVDLADALAGRRDRSGRDAAFSDTWFLDADRAAIYTDAVACQRGFDGGGRGAFVDGCFDRAADPSHSHAAPNPELEARLEAWRADQRPPADRASDVPDPVTAPPGVAAQLEALGYTDGRTGPSFEETAE